MRTHQPSRPRSARIAAMFLTGLGLAAAACGKQPARAPQPGAPEAPRCGDTPLAEVPLVEVDENAGAAELAALLRERGPDAPVRLDLSRQKRGDAFVIELAGQATLGSVRALGLAGNQLGPAAMDALAGAELACLERLDLAGNPLTDQGFAPLCRAGAQALRELVLDDTELTGAALAGLPGCAWIGALRDLSLAENDFRAVAGATGSVATAALASLDLSRAHCRVDCLALVRDAGLLASLRALRLEGFFGPDEARALVEGKAPAQLATLQLIGMADLGEDSDVLGDAGMAILSASPVLAHVQHLALPLHAIGDAGAAALAGSPHGTALRHLDLRANAIGADGARALVQGAATGKLEHLDLSDNPLSDEAIAALRAHYGERVRLTE